MSSLSLRQQERIARTLDVVRSMERVPVQYLKKLTDTGGLWEVRVQHRGDAFRLLAFWDGPRLIVLVSAFAKQSQRTPAEEIRTAEVRRRDYLDRRGEDG